MNLKGIDKKEVAIGAGVLGLSALVYWRYRNPPAAAIPPVDPAGGNVARAANSYDAAGAGGGSAGYSYSPPDAGTATVIPAPETSPVSSADTAPAAAPEPVYDPPPEPSPAPAPAPTITTYSLPPGYTPGWPYGQMPPNPGMLIGTILGFKNMGGGSNSNGSYTTFRFYSNLGNTGDWNYYFSGPKKGSWVGPFNWPAFRGAGG